MSVCGNDTISPNECDATPPPDMETITRTLHQYDSISDVSEPLQVQSHPSNSNSSQEQYD